MICEADTIGVFQIESRAQMSMLPRLRPRSFYDLVIEVAIVRPGPIQGNMVHPYLRRRSGEEPVDVSRARRCADVLDKTLGVPLFQEQAMRLAMVAAGFTPGEADQLRRAMAAWRRAGAIEQFRAEDRRRHARQRLHARVRRAVLSSRSGASASTAFPRATRPSFALLVYVSAWLKRHHPAAFAAALLNSQPMGFYAPAQIVRDAQEHGVEVRPVDVNDSDWDCTLEGRGTKLHRSWTSGRWKHDARLGRRRSRTAAGISAAQRNASKCMPNQIVRSSRAVGTVSSRSTDLHLTTWDCLSRLCAFWPKPMHLDRSGLSRRQALVEGVEVEG